jgi:hypothetical protein
VGIGLKCIRPRYYLAVEKGGTTRRRHENPARGSKDTGGGKVCYYYTVDQRGVIIDPSVNSINVLPVEAACSGVQNVILAGLRLDSGSSLE